jgi:hypothetical protein
MSRRRFELDATETFVRWLEAKCGPEVSEGMRAVVEAERTDVGNRIVDRLYRSRHYHGSADNELGDLEVLTANVVVSIVRQESGLQRRAAK